MWAIHGSYYNPNIIDPLGSTADTVGRHLSQQKKAEVEGRKYEKSVKRFDNFLISIRISFT